MIIYLTDPYFYSTSQDLPWHFFIFYFSISLLVFFFSSRWRVVAHPSPVYFTEKPKTSKVTSCTPDYSKRRHLRSRSEPCTVIALPSRNHPFRLPFHFPQWISQIPNLHIQFILSLISRSILCPKSDSLRYESLYVIPFLIIIVIIHKNDKITKTKIR